MPVFVPAFLRTPARTPAWQPGYPLGLATLRTSFLPWQGCRIVVRALLEFAPQGRRQRNRGLAELVAHTVRRGQPPRVTPASAAPPPPPPFSSCAETVGGPPRRSGCVDR